MLALMIGDTAQFWLGRYSGWALLGFLCRLSMNPETCILRSAESFYKRGKITLVIAKFIPGINTMAAPLAGSMKMRFWQFLRLDFVGALLYTIDVLASRICFARFSGSHLERVPRRRTGHGDHRHHCAGRCTRFTAPYNFVSIKSIASCREYRSRNWPRVWLRRRPDRVQIVDVRSHGYYDIGAERIAGSIRIEPNNLEEEIKHLPKDKDIYLYCT